MFTPLTVHPTCFDLNGSIEEIIRNKPIATAEILQSENLVIKEILNYKNSLASLQAKVYSLQEELAEVES